MARGFSATRELRLDAYAERFAGGDWPPWCSTTATLARVVASPGKAPRAEIKRYPTGRFDIYVGEWWERALADQAEFLGRHLLKPEPSLTH
jgi:hypothetical protein